MRDIKEYLIDAVAKTEQISREKAEEKTEKAIQEDPLFYSAFCNLLKTYGEDCVQDFKNNPKK